MSKIYGVILAGGAGSRLGGVRKTDLRIGGRRLVERAYDVLEPAVAEIAISIAAEADAPSSVPGTIIRDLSNESLGPLAGFRSAAQYFADGAAEDVIVFLAVDTPFAPENYVGALAGAARLHGSCYCAWGDNAYPTNSAFRLSALRKGLESASETDGPKAILRSLGAERVDWTGQSRDDPFSNLNTLFDLIALQRRFLAASDAPLRQSP